MITTSNQETNRTCLVRGLSFPAPAKAISSGRSTLFTINIMHLRLLHEVNEFQESCRQASLVTLYSNLLNTYFIKWRMRVATGSDFVRFLSHNACLTDESIVVVGNVTDAQAAQVIEGRRVDVISPGWGFMKDAVAVADIVARCRALNPEVIFIAVGAPQSEKLTLRLHQAVLRAPSILCCGAAFEFELGMQKRSSEPSRWSGWNGLAASQQSAPHCQALLLQRARFIVSIIGQLKTVANSGMLLVGGLRLNFQTDLAESSTDGLAVSPGTPGLG